jgi:predicted RNA-binding protein YlxR (DUF448 family)
MLTCTTKNQRSCLACRRLGPKEVFWRIVRVWPLQQVQLDRGLGRSAYLCPIASCLKLAERKDRLSKVLKAKVPPELYRELWFRLGSAAEHGR